MSTVALGDIANWGSGGTPLRSVREYFGAGLPWLSIADLNDGLVGDAKESLTPLGIEHSSAKPVPPGTLLVAMYGSIGKLGIAARELCTSQAIAFAIPDTRRVDTRYLFHFLLSERPRLQSRGRGGTQSNIGQGDLKAWQMPLPPLPEQRRIAAILDGADAMRAKRRTAIQRLDELTQSIFLDMFGDPTINPKGWSEDTRLGDVADIVSGITKGRKLNGQPARTVPYLAVANVQHRALDLSMVKSIEATDAEIDRYRLVNDDLLLTEGGDPDKLGRGTLWRGELPVCIHQNHIFRVRLTSATLHPLFLSWLVGSQRGRSYFLRSAKQTTGIASINMTQLRGFPLLVPPIELQQKFVTQVVGVEQLRTKLSEAASKANNLFASLQHRVFRGGLGLGLDEGSEDPSAFRR